MRIPAILLAAAILAGSAAQHSTPIQQRPVQGQSLAPPVEIKKVYRLGSQSGAGGDLKTVVAGLRGLSLHDQCTGDYPPQPDTCIHQQLDVLRVTAR